MHSGRVTKLYYIAGETAKVHSPLYAIDVDGEDVELPNQEIESQEHKLELVKQPANVTQSEINNKVLTTPAVRKLAREHDLDLNLISGSGKSGRILKEDVLEYLKPDLNAPLLSLTKAIEDRSEAIVGVRKIMANHMADSVATIPHFTFVDDVDVTELLELRAFLKSRYTEEVKITLMPLLIKALSLSISAFPIVNSRVDGDFSEITYLASHNIGMAVDGKTGLLVPNIKNVQQRSIIDIAHEVTRLTDAARSGVINPSDLKDGTITISNIGAIGGVSASPIINKPEVAIVALGKIQKLPRFNDEGQLEERHIMTMSWSGDHRVIDGATIARFNNSWKAYLENPSTMLANMV
jgi:2-oxoisovalerate dehydrogenase E2 component (dihydrolipoyl transacylase)